MKNKIQLKRIALIIAALAVVVALFFILEKGHVSKTPLELFDLGQDSALSAPEEAATQEEIQSALNEKVADGMINISMNLTPSFPDSSAEGDLQIVNSEVNSYPQVVEIFRDDTGEKIYTSGGIPIGKGIVKDFLDSPLKKGVYPCTAYFHAVNPETNQAVGTAAAKIQITVLA